LKLKKVDYNIANQRFDRYLRKYFKPYPDIKLSDIYSRIRKGAILVNNKKKKENYILLLGDEIKFTNIKTGDKKPNIMANTKENKLDNLKLKDIAPMIIYEDDNWIVFNKPSGVVAHPSNKHVNDIAMNDYLDKYCEIKNIATEDETFKPSFGYRLDKDTSGVLIAAKNYDALQYINKIIRDRNIDKEYHTIISGDFPNHLISEQSIEKIYDKKFGSSRMVVDEN
jgi:23S rRNA pseudouridine955/2504/2580 synthase